MPSQKEIVVSHIDMILEYTLKSRASGEEGGGTFLVSPCKYNLLLARGRGGGQMNLSYKIVNFGVEKKLKLKSNYVYYSKTFSFIIFWFEQFFGKIESPESFSFEMHNIR